MIQRREAPALNAIATLLVIGGFAVPEWSPSLRADGDNGLEANESIDPVLQPGIVEEMTSPRSGGWKLFDWFDAPSKLHAAASFSGNWNDNVLLTENSPIEDFLWATDLAAWFESSDPDERQRNYLRLGYDPQILTYDDLDELDSVNHRWFAGYQYNGSRFLGKISHRYAQFSAVSQIRDSGVTPGSILSTDSITTGAPDTAQRDLTNAELDLGRRIQGVREVTSAFALIDLSDETRFRPAANRRFERINRLDGSETFEEWSVEGILYRESSRKLRLGLGPRFGRAEFSRANDQDYQQGLAYLRFRHSPKMQVDAMAGVDYRKYGPRGEHQTTPLFLARFTWAPSERTVVSVEGFQRARASFQGDAATNLGCRMALSQNLFRRLDYSMGCGYVTSDFADGGEANVLGQRVDDFVFVRSSLDYGVAEAAGFSVFYEYRDSRSNQRPGFQQGLTGLSVSFEF